MKAQIVSPDHDFEALAAALNNGSWDDPNEMPNYQPESIRSFVSRQDAIMVICYPADAGGQKHLAGVATGRVQHNPADTSRWLFIDEVDVCVNHRRKGAGRAMMQLLFEVAKEQGCDEAWLGVEVDNDGAHQFYRSLYHRGAEGMARPFTGYTFS